MPKAKKSKKTGLKIFDKFHKKTESFLLMESILFGLAALLIFIKPITILTSLAFIFGIFLAIIGLYQISSGFKSNNKNNSANNLTIAFGIMNLVLGLVFLLQPSGALYTIIYVFAILFFIKSIKFFIFSLKLYKAKSGKHLIDIIISGIMLLLSVVVLFFPEISLVTFMYYIGFMFLVYAVSDARMYAAFMKIKNKEK